MTENSVTQQQLISLKKKLDSAIEARGILESNSHLKTSLLVNFINKLSQVSKGTNLTLDNQLAQLRTLFTKSAALGDIEAQISIINKSLQQQSLSNEQNITYLNKQFLSAGENLQKAHGLPDALRRKLRVLLKEAATEKKAVVQYIPLLAQLVAFYNDVLKIKLTLTEQERPSTNSINDSATVNSATQKTNTPSVIYNNQTDPALVEKIANKLVALNLSKVNTRELLSINEKLFNGLSGDKILQHILAMFDIIVADLRDEKDSARDFLSTLSSTLTSVQKAVEETLVIHTTSQLANDKVNQKLALQLDDMTCIVQEASSLNRVKIDINTKLQLISRSLEEKSLLEQQSQHKLNNKLGDMAAKVSKLEEQSRFFEEKIAEQQQKSMQDALTKLANRAAFDNYFAKAMVRFHHRPFRLALVVIDIDDFKKINDTYGHAAGDRTLQVIATSIVKRVGSDVFVGRYGGEEFVLIYSAMEEDKLMKELNLLKQYIASLPFQFKNTKVNITLSLGATHIKSGDNIHIAFERADKAMYQAKNQGKNQVIYLE